VKNQHELRDFVLTFLWITLRTAVLGGLLLGAVGVIMALLAGAIGAGEAMTRARFLAIVANYAVFGALGGGIIGLVSGLLTQQR
jgi:hypothetical protein